MTTINTPIGRVMIKNARLAFPNVFEASSVNGEGEPRFGATLILSDEEQIAVVNKAIEAVAKEKWAAKADVNLKALRGAGKVALRNIRRDARKTLETAEKNSEISKDDLERAEKELDKLTQDHVANIDKAVARKEQELLEV